jgi:tetratricopeptide (TPR) repeat protein/tRNA A-37 threonylcarbamoyl transferase component Bud32
MGEVWSGSHRAHGIPVAIKVIRRNWIDERVYLDAFAREVRAVASLDHPGIVSVYDHGRAATAVTTPWGEELEQGSPYLVMEYVERGSLDELLDVMTWPLVRHITLGVLDALGHAHARGVVHKDLKPGNVLLTSDASGAVCLKLTDFGVAHALTPKVAGDLTSDHGAVSAGTPAYMPPEQIVGQWRDYGPWTDLYALGCMVWELCTGAPPFDADTLSRLAALHLFNEPPRLTPRFEVPDGLERWLRRLLRKNLWERYPTTADAAWALTVLEPGASTAPTWEALDLELGTRHALDVQTTRPFEELEPTAPMNPRVFTVLGWGDAVRAVDARERVATLDPPEAHDAHDLPPLSPTGALPSLRPPFPQDWRRPEHSRASRPLLGAGLGLYGLREIRLVGRHAERDHLWGALSQARHEGRPRAVLMRGPSGVGKSRLVEWLCVRAQESGAAAASRASHEPFGGPSQGLERMLTDDLRAHGLREQDLLRRLLATLERDAPELSADAATQEAAALASLMHGGEAVDLGPRAPRVRLGSDRERFAVLTRHLRRRSRHRPLILWLDDVQWGDASLNFARQLLDARHDDLPVLIALTVREDLLAERHAEASHLADLARRGDVLELDVAPLPDDDHRALIAELLVFDDALVDQIAQRTRGNPLFAVQLIGDWVERGILEPSDSGFTLRPGATAQLPDDVHALWRQRIGRLMHDHLHGEPARQARAALEIAAALGLEVDAREWRTALDLAHVSPPAELVQLLVEQRLARQTQTGFSFVHAMLRESLERLAHDAGDALSHHACCAGALRALYGAHALGHAERVAAHLREAGRVEQALEPLLDASYQAQLMGHYARAERALNQHDEATRELELTPNDPRRLRAEAQRAWLDWLRAPPGGGAASRVTSDMDSIQDRALAADVHDVVGECLRWRGLVARFAQDFETSLALLERAYARFQLADSPEGIARTALSMAVALRALGRLDEAELMLVGAIEAADSCGLYVLLPRCFGNLAEVSMLRGDWPKARQRFERAAQVASTAGDRKAQAFALTGQGDVAMTYQDWDAADARYAEAERLFSTLGSHYRHWARLERACVWVLADDPDRAEPHLRSFLSRHSGRDLHQDALAHLGLACVAGARDDWGGFGSHFGAAQNLLARTDASRPVFVQLADHAAELAAGGEHPRLARAAEAFALRQELALDRDEEEE